MLSALKKLFSPNPINAQAHRAYLALVAQSRLPQFYRDWQVADTVDGRFDMLVLHLHLLLERLEAEFSHIPLLSSSLRSCGASADTRGEGEDIRAFYRALTELFFADMDRSLREMGAGDTGVGKRVKNMAEAFYGRRKAYAGDQPLEEALRRNVWRQQAVDDVSVKALAAYMRRMQQTLRGQNISALLAGEIVF